MLHQIDRLPLVADPCNDRPVLGVIGGDGLFGHAIRRLEAYDDAARPDGQLPVPVTVVVAAASAGDRLQEPGDIPHAARGVHPAGRRIEALIDEELTPGDGAIRVEPLPAHHLQLGAEIEGGVRVDPQHRVVIQGDRRGDRDAVRALSLRRRQRGAGGRLRRQRLPAIECRQLR